MGFNITSIKTSSDGAWQGDNPLNFAFPLLIVQTTLILVLSRFLAFLLKPLRQPKVIAEIVVSIFTLIFYAIDFGSIKSVMIDRLSQFVFYFLYLERNRKKRYKFNLID